MNALVLSMLLAGIPAQPPGVAAGVGEVKLDGSLFVMDLDPRGLSAEEIPVTKTLADLIATDLSSQMRDRKLVTASEVRELIDVETERALANCDDEGCLAEIAGALDAGFILFGGVSKVGTRYILTLSLADRNGVVVDRESLKAADLDALIDGYPSALAPIVGLLEGKEAEAVASKPTVERAEPEVAEAAPEGSPVWGLVVFGSSTVVAVAMGVMAWGTSAVVGDPTAETPTRSQMQLMLWGSTVTAGLAVGGMGVGTMMVLGE